MATVLVALQIVWVWSRARRSARTADLAAELRPPHTPAVQATDPRPTGESG